MGDAVLHTSAWNHPDWRLWVLENVFSKDLMNDDFMPNTVLSSGFIAVISNTSKNLCFLGAEILLKWLFPMILRGEWDQLGCPSAFWGHHLRSLMQLNWAGSSKVSLTYLELHCSSVWPPIVASSTWRSQGHPQHGGLRVSGFPGLLLWKLASRGKAEAARLLKANPELAQHHYCHIFLVKASQKANPDSSVGERDST